MKYLKDVVTLQLNADKCIGCGRCLQVCPHGVFRADGRKVCIQDKDACMECGACSVNCLSGAITVKRGVGCATAVMNGWISGSEPKCNCSDDCR